jgi:uncharacterized protein YdaU (DUF1376 family)
MSRPPAFQFYAAEYLADEHVQLMTISQEGIYIRLLAYCWREGSIPADINALSMLCKGASTNDIKMVAIRFKQCSTDGSRLVHPRLEVEREKQQDWREKSAKGGRASAHKRKKPKEIIPQQGGATNSQAARLNQRATLQSSSSSSTSLTTEEKERQQQDVPRASRSADGRGTRLPESFALKPDLRLWAESNAAHVDLDVALAEFRDYWCSVAGVRGRKLDWDATFRNRLRELEGRKASNGSNKPGNGFTTANERRSASFNGLLSVVQKLRDESSGAVDEDVCREPIAARRE